MLYVHTAHDSTAPGWRVGHHRGTAGSPRSPPGREKKKRPGNKDCETSCALKLSPYQSGTKQKTPPLFEPTRTSIVGRGPLSQAASPQCALRPTWASARFGGAVRRAAFGAAICRASEKSLAAPTPLRRRYFAVTWPRAIRRRRHHLSMPKIRSNKHTCTVANILPTLCPSSSRLSPRPRDVLRHHIHPSRLRNQTFGIPDFNPGHCIFWRGFVSMRPNPSAVRRMLGQGRFSKANARVNNMESSDDRALVRMDFPNRIQPGTPSM